MVSTSLLLPLFLLFLFMPSTEAAASNLETFFPSLPSPAISLQPPPSSPPHLPAEESDVKVIKAVIATATSSFALSGLLFFVFFRLGALGRGQEPRQPSSGAKPPKRIVSSVHSNGVEAVYLREFNQGTCDSCNGRLHPYAQREEDPEGDLTADGHVEDTAPSPPRNYGRKTQESPLLPIDSLRSSSKAFSESFRSGSFPSGKFSADMAPKPRSPLTSARSASSRPPLPPSWPPQPSMTASNVSPVPPPPSRPTSKSTSAFQPTPPPSATKPNAAPSHPIPPSPSMESNAAPSPPSPPSAAIKSNAAPSPPPPLPQAAMKANAVPTPPPPPPPWCRNGMVPAAPSPLPAVGPTLGGASPPPAWEAAGGKKLKPLHWDKLNRQNVEHSMVWDKITDNSCG